MKDGRILSTRRFSIKTKFQCELQFFKKSNWFLQKEWDRISGPNRDQINSLIGSAFRYRTQFFKSDPFCSIEMRNIDFRPTSGLDQNSDWLLEISITRNHIPVPCTVFQRRQIVKFATLKGKGQLVALIEIESQIWPNFRNLKTVVIVNPRA